MAERKETASEQAERDRFAQRALVASVIFVAIAALAVFLWYSVYVLFLLFAGVLLAIFLRALADLVSHYTRLSHRWSLAIVLVVLVLAGAAFWMLVAQSLVRQVGELSSDLPK